MIFYPLLVRLLGVTRALNRTPHLTFCEKKKKKKKNVKGKQKLLLKVISPFLTMFFLTIYLLQKKENVKGKQKLLVISDFSFSSNVFDFYSTCFSFLIHYYLLSVISLNLDKSKILLSGNGLMPAQFVID